jgi:sugar phosphate isomerase/epimerase
MADIKKKVQVSIPFSMLFEKYLDRFIEERFNPEIGLDADALDRFSLNDFKTVANKLSDNGLKVTFHGPFLDLSPGSPDPLIREVTRRRYEQVLDLFPIFQPKTMVCHAGYHRTFYGFASDLWLENSLETWRWLSERVKNVGAMLTLENVFESGPEEMKPLFENLEDCHVGLCFDIGHQACFSQTSFQVWMNQLGPYVEHLHLHDNHGLTDEHRGLGFGTIQFKAFFTLLTSFRKTSPVVTLEPHFEEEVYPSLEFLEKYWPWT